MGAVDDESGVPIDVQTAALLPAPDAMAGELRAHLVAQLRSAGVLRDEAVERALLRVPRHLFLPQVAPVQAYADTAVPTHWEGGVPVSSASQPSIVALMLEQLQVAPGMRVLEIGAGTGYNAALLAELVGASGQVTSIEIDAEIAAEAREHLATAGYASVRVLAVDGWEGCADGAPYDRIILTVGASDISPAWFDQLADDGLLVLPLWLRAAEASVAFRKRWGMLKSESLMSCGFMRLRGVEAGPDQWVALPGGWHLGGERARDLADPIAALLATRPRRRLWMRPAPSFAQYLGLRGVSLVALWPDARRAGRRRARGRLGLYLDEERGGPALALFATNQPFLLSYGTPVAEQVLDAEAARWKGLQLSPVESWTVVSYPRHGVDGTPDPAESAVRLVRRHFVFDILLDTPSDSYAPIQTRSC